MDKKFNLETIITVPRSFQKDLEQLFEEYDTTLLGDSWDDYLELLKAITLNQDSMPCYGIKIKYVEDKEE